MCSRGGARIVDADDDDRWNASVYAMRQLIDGVNAQVSEMLRGGPTLDQMQQRVDATKLR